jgi:hypothetical protein
MLGLIFSSIDFGSGCISWADMTVGEVVVRA